jgi:hypothetical protein
MSSNELKRQNDQPLSEHANKSKFFKRKKDVDEKLHKIKMKVASGSFRLCSRHHFLF